MHIDAYVLGFLAPRGQRTPVSSPSLSLLGGGCLPLALRTPAGRVTPRQTGGGGGGQCAATGCGDSEGWGWVILWGVPPYRQGR